MTKPTDPEDPADLRREIYDKAKEFERKVAHLFTLQGCRTTLDYKRDDMQFDIRLESMFGIIPIHALVECKDVGDGVTQKDVREFASKVEYAAGEDKLNYQAILVSSTGFVNNAHEVARNKKVQLTTYDQLLRSLVNLEPAREAAIHAFRGTPLEPLYVEQDVVFDRDIRPGQELQRKSLTGEILRWINESPDTFLALLGDFGCGKSSFAKRLACEVAQGPTGTRVPVLVDLKEGGSTTVTLENLLTHCFQRLSSQPFNPQAFLQLNREGYLVLIFDGFDETIAYTEAGRYLENLRQILRAAEGKAKVIMTCRTHYFRSRPEALRNLGKAPVVASTEGATSLWDEIQKRPGAEVGYLLEFQEEQISEYLRKAISPPADWQAFREQIRTTYNLEDLAERPFLLEIIVRTLPRLMTRKGEVTLADLYETYCEGWFSHTDSRLTLTREFKVSLVEYLARLVWDSPGNRVHFKTLLEKASAFVQDRQLTAPEKERIDYEIRTALFLSRDNDGNYSFIHRSFLEFFVARTLRDGLGKGDAGCLALKRITREVAFFLELWPAAKRIPERAGQILQAPYQTGVSENALLLLYLHARAKLGPLVGPRSAVEPDLQEIQGAFSALRPKNLRLDGADLEGAALPGIDLSGARLEGARLGRSDLRQASLDGAKLAKADLGSVDFRHGRAEGADLAEASLDHMDGREARFQKASFRNADLSFARLSRADLRDADLVGIKSVGTALLGSLGTETLSLPDTAGTATASALELRWQTGHTSAVSSVAWSPDGRCVATGSYDGSVKVWDATSGQILRSIAGHGNAINAVSWSADGTRLASGASDKTVKVWEASSGRLLNTLSHDSSVNSIAWSLDGTRLASGAYQAVKVWEASSGRLLNTLTGHDNAVFSISWSPDGTRLASGSWDQTVKVWDAATGRVLNTLSGHDNSVFSVSWSPDGTRLASGADDRTVKIWDAATGLLLNTLSGHDASVRSVAWSPDGTRLASGAADKTVKVWDAATGRVLNTLAGHVNVVLTVAWSADGTRLASGAQDRTVKVWEVATGRVLNTLTGHDSFVFSVSWSADGTRLASGAYQTIKVWDASSGRLLNTLTGHDNAVVSVSWSPDGTRLASGSDDRTVKIWDAATGRVLNTLTGHDKLVFSVSWSPDGTRLASGSDDNTVKVWDAATGRVVNTLTGHDNSVFSVAWSPDGTRLASGSDDNTVKVWDAATGRLLNTLTGHDNSVFSVSWSPDGTRLASGSSVFVDIWDVGTEEPRLLARFFSAPSGLGGLATPDGYVFGPPEALDWVRFGDGWALYDVTEVPERVSEERVLAALKRSER